MNNKITDLRNHMFQALERLNDESITPEQMAQEITKARAISELGKVIVESAKAEAIYLRNTDRSNGTGFIPDETKTLNAG